MKKMWMSVPHTPAITMECAVTSSMSIGAAVHKDSQGASVISILTTVHQSLASMEEPAWTELQAIVVAAVLDLQEETVRPT